ncbi:MAG: NifB/NifX family molybdenum-iron cluster-binding protein [Victivallaceae bacterium]|nr:NifB/NifX family molybdenum-iron cluster-binding protein [Victivallaceae bacterium]
MIIAIPVAEESLCMHFGHCEKFRLFTVDDRKMITGTADKIPPPHEPGILPRWLGELKVDLVIAGGMGARAQQLFAQTGVKVITGAPAAEPREIVEAFLAGNLETGGNVCDH